MTVTSLTKLVDALTELYQPVYGHREFDALARRPTADRLHVISKLVKALAASLGRQVRILDLGCAQGYLSLSLAALGAKVTGVDREATNIALCRALASEHPDLDVEFVESDVRDVLHAVASGERTYDLVLALNVMHHVSHEQGLATSRALLRDAGERIEGIVAEVALGSEPLYWAAAQGDDPRAIVDDYAFVHRIGQAHTHLSDALRPIYFASNRWWWLGGDLRAIDSWTRQSHELVGDFHGLARRYYQSGTLFAKYFVFTSGAEADSRRELAGEAAFLAAPPPGVAAPRLIGYGIEEDFGWLVRERLPGRRLSTLIAEGVSFDRKRVIMGVLDRLCELEAAGLYHADLRIWNVIVDDHGGAQIIDYGDIRDTTACAWPGNVFLSFPVFVYEALQERLPRIFPTRAPRFSPEHFPEPYRTWMAAIWRTPPTEWTFAHMRDLLRDPTSAPGGSAFAQDASWTAAVEEYLDVLGSEQQHLTGLVARLPSAGRELSSIGPELAAARAERTQLQSDLAESRLACRHAEEIIAELGRELERQRHDREQSEAALQSSLMERAKEIRDLRASRDGIEADRVESGALLAAREREIGALRSSLAEETRARADAELRVRDLDAERERQRIEAHRWWRSTAQLSEELKLVYGTASWRITAPLRWAKRIFTPPAADSARGTGPMQRGVGAAARFVRGRPRLHAWLGAHLDRFPPMKARLKNMASEAHRASSRPGDAGPGAGPSGSLGRRTGAVHAAIQRAIARRRAPEDESK